MLDYILAFTLLGTAAWFAHLLGKEYTATNIAFGTFVVCAIRFCVRSCRVSHLEPAERTGV